MKVLVTGGTGFVGSHSAAELVRAGHDVRLFVRNPEKARRTFDALGIACPECATGDVTDAASVSAALEGCEAVLHSAALVALDARSAAQVDRTNRVGTENVVGEAYRRGLGPIVYVSSVSALFDPDAGPMGPDSPPTHLAGSPYGESKARTEIAVRRLQDEGAPIVSTYPSGVLGPHAPELTEPHRALPLQLRVALLMEGAVSYVDVRDLAKVHAALIARAPGPGRFLACGPDLSWAEVADVIDAVTGRRVPRIRVSARLMRGLGRLGDALKRVVRFELPLTYEGMLTATRWPGVDASATRRELGTRFRDPQETFADTLRWMGETGRIPAGALGRLAP